jgi:hypothetical protein
MEATCLRNYFFILICIGLNIGAFGYKLINCSKVTLAAW